MRSPTSRVSRFCLRKMRFSLFAHSIFSFVTVICVSRLPGMLAKKSMRVRMSFAVFALAIVLMKEREERTTSASASALPWSRYSWPSSTRAASFSRRALSSDGSVFASRTSLSSPSLRLDAADPEAAALPLLEVEVDAAGNDMLV